MSIINELGALSDLVEKKPDPKEARPHPLSLNILGKKQDIGGNDEDYFSIPYYSASIIKEYIKNPSSLSKFKAGIYRKESSSDALKFGTIMHRIILEGDDGSTYDAIMKKSEQNIKLKVLWNFYKNKLALNILKDYKYREKVFLWEEEIRGEKVWCKSKIDLFTKSGFLVDLKTCATLEDIKYHLDKYRYDLSMAFYLRALEASGEEVKGVAFIAIEKTDPFECHVFELDNSYLERGKNGGEIRNKRVMGWREALEEMHFKPRKRFENIITKLSL